VSWLAVLCPFFLKLLQTQTPFSALILDQNDSSSNQQWKPKLGFHCNCIIWWKR